MGGPAPASGLIAAFFVLWTLYAFVGGILAVPYNDIVARSIPSARRSRLLALRFFAGGLLALGVAAVAGRAIDALAFPTGHAVVLLTGAGLLLVSALSFVSTGEPLAPEPTQATGFGPFLREGLDVFRQDRRFSLFVGARWLDGTVMMALPFYVVAATEAGVTAAEVATLLGAQTAGALLSNPLWGWWGDRLGKRRLLGVTAVLAIAAPLLTVLWTGAVPPGGTSALPAFAAVFLILGAVNNGGNIAHLGYLWEISPDDRGRPTAVTSMRWWRRQRCRRSWARQWSRRSAFPWSSWRAPWLPSARSSPSIAFAMLKREWWPDVPDLETHTSTRHRPILVAVQALVSPLRPPGRGTAGGRGMVLCLRAFIVSYYRTAAFESGALRAGTLSQVISPRVAVG